MRWVIGDIHGMYGPLNAMLDALSALDADARFYFVGDYVNRGPQSREVLELLTSLPEGRAKFCRGNHDDVLDLILHDQWLGGENDAFEPLAACVWFLKHGLADTVASYDVDDDELDYHRYHPSEELLKLIRTAIPAEHKRFIRGLPICIDEPDAFVAHAFWPPEETIDVLHVADRLEDAAMRHRVVWERYKASQIVAKKPWRRPAFFGHTPTQNYGDLDGSAEGKPICGPHVTLLDTAIALGSDGRLTAVSIEDGRVVQIDRKCKVVR
ncbi:MAG: metallophosphoesterase [Tepidisphaeraceae bacterium]